MYRVKTVHYNNLERKSHQRYDKHGKNYTDLGLDVMYKIIYSNKL
jgi:hypothetical protein